MTSKTLLVGAALGVLVSAGAPASAAFVPWTVDNGSAAGFSFANGGSEDGLFGDPFIFGNTFFFTPAGFQAQATNGASDSISSTLSVDLMADGGFQFSQVRIDVFGEYFIDENGDEPNTGSVDATGMIDIDDLNSTDMFSSPLVTNPLFPVSGDTAGSINWMGSITLNLGAGLTDVHLEWTQGLLAVASANGSSNISFTVGQQQIAVTIIPAPGAAMLLGLGSLAAVRRRR